MNIEDALSKIQQKLGVPRGEAIQVLIDNKDDPFLKKIEGAEELLSSHPYVKRFLSEAATSLEVPFAWGLSKIAPETFGPLLEEIKKRPEQYAPGPKIPESVPVLGGAPWLSLAGSMIGGALPFGRAEKVVQGVADIGKQLFNPAIRGMVAGTERVVPSVLAASRLERAAVPTIAGAGVGYTYNESPEEAAVGGVFGLAAGVLRMALSKPIAGVRSSEVQSAIQRLARLSNKSPEEIVQKMRGPQTSVADLQAELAAKNAGPMDINKVATESLTPDEMQAAGMVYPGPDPSMPEAMPKSVWPQHMQDPWGMQEPVGPGTVKFGQKPPGKPSPVFSGGTELVGRAEKGFLGPSDPFGEATFTDLKSQKAWDAVFGPASELEKTQAVGELGGKVKKPISWRDLKQAVEEDPAIPPGQKAKTITEAQKIIEEGTKEGQVVLEKARKTLTQKLTEERGSTSEPTMRSNHIVDSYDIDPAEWFSDAGPAREFVGEAKKSGMMRAFVDWVYPQAQLFMKDLTTRKWYMDIVEHRDRLMRIVHTMRNRTEKAVAKHLGGDKGKFEEATRILEGTQRMADGTLSQVEKSADEAINRYAWSVRNLLDRAYRMVSGVHSRAAVIMHDVGLKTDDPQAWRRSVQTVEGLLKKLRGGEDIILDKISVEHKLAAYKIFEAEGKSGRVYINTTMKDSTVPYESGYFSHFPIENERAKLMGHVAEFETRKALGFVDPLSNEEAALKQNMEAAQKRLGLIDRAEAERASRDFPLRGVIPGRSRSTVFNIARNPDAAPFEFSTEIPDVLGRYFNLLYSKSLKDFIYARTRSMIDEVKDPYMRQRIKDFVDLQRGSEAMHNNAWMEKTRLSLQDTFGIKLNRLTSDRAVADLLKAQVVLKLFVSPRFYYLNLFESITNVQPVVGWKPFMRATVDALSFGKTARSKLAWTDAAIHGDIFEEAAGFLHGGHEGPIMSKASWVARQQRIVQKMIAYRSFVYASQEPGFLKRAQHMLPSYYVDPKVTKISISEVRKIARAGVRETTYDYSKMSAPRIVSGSKLGAVTFQFQQYGVRYAAQIANMIKYAKATGDVKPIGSAVAGWVMMGGLPAVSGATAGIASWPFIQKQILKRTGWKPPDVSPIQGGLQALGFGFRNPIDMNEQMNPMSMLLTELKYKGNILGPTFGMIPQLIQELGQDGVFTPGGVHDMVRAVSPEVAAFGESVTEAARGGIFTEKGKRLARREPSEIVARALNLQRNTRSSMKRAYGVIRAAYESRDPEAIRNAIADARAAGFMITSERLRAMKNAVARERKKKTPKWGETFG